MAKEVVINTSAVNSYGSRVITAGLDTTQYEKNPVLLWMHRRYGDNSMPIGRIANLRREGDRLIGTPEFDMDDDFAKKVANKWEKGYLNMCSASVEILETSVDPADLVAGQTRATVTHGKLLEVSIVDIGSNDDALKLTNGSKLLELKAGEASEILPLLELSQTTDNADTSAQSNNQNNNKMNKETLLLLGLSEQATDEQVHSAVLAMKAKADNADALQLANVTAAVDAAIAERRITADHRDHFINLGKTSGFKCLSETLAMMQPARKPNDVVNLRNDKPAGGAAEKPAYKKLSDVPENEVMNLRNDKPDEYARLYEAEYGVKCPKLN